MKLVPKHKKTWNTTSGPDQEFKFVLTAYSVFSLAQMNQKSFSISSTVNDQHQLPWGTNKPLRMNFKFAPDNTLSFQDFITVYSKPGSSIELRWCTLDGTAMRFYRYPSDAELGKFCQSDTSKDIFQILQTSIQSHYKQGEPEIKQDKNAGDMSETERFEEFKKKILQGESTSKKLKPVFAKWGACQVLAESKAANKNQINTTKELEMVRNAVLKRDLTPFNQSVSEKAEKFVPHITSMEKKTTPSVTSIVKTVEKDTLPVKSLVKPVEKATSVTSLLKTAEIGNVSSRDLVLKRGPTSSDNSVVKRKYDSNGDLVLTHSSETNDKETRKKEYDLSDYPMFTSSDIIRRRKEYVSAKDLVLEKGPVSVSKGSVTDLSSKFESTKDLVVKRGPVEDTLNRLPSAGSLIVTRGPVTVDKVNSSIDQITGDEEENQEENTFDNVEEEETSFVKEKSFVNEKSFVQETNKSFAKETDKSFADESFNEVGMDQEDIEEQSSFQDEIRSKLVESMEVKEISVLEPKDGSLYPCLDEASVLVDNDTSRLQAHHSPSKTIPLTTEKLVKESEPTLTAEASRSNISSLKENILTKPKSTHPYSKSPQLKPPKLMLTVENFANVVAKRAASIQSHYKQGEPEIKQDKNAGDMSETERFEEFKKKILQGESTSKKLKPVFAKWGACQVLAESKAANKNQINTTKELEMVRNAVLKRDLTPFNQSVSEKAEKFVPHITSMEKKTTPSVTSIVKTVEKDTLPVKSLVKPVEKATSVTSLLKTAEIGNVSSRDLVLKREFKFVLTAYSVFSLAQMNQKSFSISSTVNDQHQLPWGTNKPLRMNFKFAPDNTLSFQDFITVYSKPGSSIELRWCTLDGTAMRFYRYPSDAELGKSVNQIDIKKISSKPLKAPNEMCITPHAFFFNTKDDSGSNSTNLFACTSRKKMDEWISALNLFISMVKLD
ncbi:uncharacterized protein LOC103521899 [Diaphorina citri]|uniref:Uncharacterized protein LOC103521899 n=1 Tax=Diaphorina citri TaxID=121845 RepID=A0A1S3DPY5_DIACI|nr:uncharacterized protein LOC103521899 [Diaphorina citri]